MCFYTSYFAFSYCVLFNVDCITKNSIKNDKNIAKKYKMSYTKIIEERENKRRNFMEETNAESIEKLERERESFNVKDIGFNSIAKKLYIKYRKIKINLTEVGNQKSEVRHRISDVGPPLK